jgi:hypothetical protein
MKVERLAANLGVLFIGVFVIAGVSSPAARAQAARVHSDHSSRDQAGALVKLVRDVTERFKDVRVAEEENYHLLFGCVSGPDSGAMGMHFVNLGLVFDDGVVDPTKPEIVIYEPQPNGRLRLIGADYLVPAKDWHTANPDALGAPVLMGQIMHLFEAPNRFGLESFYTLHVWAWKDNPTGMFVNWHSKVSCEAFNGDR